MQLTQLNSVQPISAKKVSRVIILLTFLHILHSKILSPGKLVVTSHRPIWRHDLQTESTGSRRSELIGDSCSRCERVDNSTSSWVASASLYTLHLANVHTLTIHSILNSFFSYFGRQWSWTDVQDHKDSMFVVALSYLRTRLSYKQCHASVCDQPVLYEDEWLQNPGP